MLKKLSEKRDLLSKDIEDMSQQVKDRLDYIARAKGALEIVEQLIKEVQDEEARSDIRREERVSAENS